jgi:AbrB family looped-hinge helix DNA binding protein
MAIKSKRRKIGKPKYAARLTSKYQATVPKEIRKHLHLESGDQIVYELLPDDTVIVRKTSPLDLDYLQALNTTMNEWESAEDEQAYKNL